jgi:hypothetical protein
MISIGTRCSSLSPIEGDGFSCAPTPRAGRRCTCAKIRGTRAVGLDHEQAALRQGQVAVNSILRDWIKGQVTAVECGILSFEAVFLPYMLTADGRPLVERISETELLPKPSGPKVVKLPVRP